MIAIPSASRRTRVVSLTLPPLHSAQAQFVNDPHRVVVAAAGTKCGKTMGLSIWLLRNAWNNYQSLNWWCAPTLAQAKFAYDYIGRWLPPNHYKPNRNDFAYYLLRANGSIHSTIQFKSADNPESLRGAAVNAAVVDEAGYWQRDSFISVQTTLTRTRGPLRIISTPKGRNWFYEEWLKGDPNNPKRDPEYSSYRLPTSSNPFVPSASIEYARRNMTEQAFRQEYLAEFLADGAGVFTNIDNCSVCSLYDRPMVGHHYVVGIDWAKQHDYTVFVVMDIATREIAHIARHHEIDWNVNMDRAVRTAKHWNNAAILMDSTGVGDVPYDQIRAVYGNTYGYSISTNAKKKALIQKLQVALERSEIGLPKPALHMSQTDAEKRRNAEILINELRTYESRVTSAGVMQYSAPEGFFDDCVIATALANWMCSEEPFVYRYHNVAGV